MLKLIFKKKTPSVFTETSIFPIVFSGSAKFSKRQWVSVYFTFLLVAVS